MCGWFLNPKSVFNRDLSYQMGAGRCAGSAAGLIWERFGEETTGKLGLQKEGSSCSH